MLSLQECREFLGSEPITDEQLAQLRDAFYSLADLALRSHAGGQLLRRPTTFDLLTESERDAAEERAAILEFDAGVLRHVAERLALEEALGNRRRFMSDQKPA